MFYLSSGSVSSCDAFLNVFQSHGLKPEVICPCATSPEALTVAIRRYQIYMHICLFVFYGRENKLSVVALWLVDGDTLCGLATSHICCSCRPGVRGAPLPARAILSMGGLSHGVIRVNTEDKNSALTVQDVGHIMPGGQPMQELHIIVHSRIFSRFLNEIFDLSIFQL